MVKCRRPHLSKQISPSVSGMEPYDSPSQFQWKFLRILLEERVGKSRLCQ
jgi:hypothetical protein